MAQNRNRAVLRRNTNETRYRVPPVISAAVPRINHRPIGRDVPVRSDVEAVAPIEPTRRTDAFTERRSVEGTANAAALRLGLAAQMLASRGSNTAGVLPLDPATRMAAHYASTAQGPSTLTLGFSRTI